MFQRFTERAQRIILIAQEEAKRLHHDYVGPEHLMLAIIALGEGVAAQVLANFRVDLRLVRSEIEKSVATGDDASLLGEIPFTPDAKKALECSVEESQTLGHSYIGTEHLLLGLFRLESTAKLLRERSLTIEGVRQEVVKLLGKGAYPFTHTGRTSRTIHLGQQLLAVSISPGVKGILLASGSDDEPTIIILLKEGTTPDAAYLSLASVLPEVGRLRFKEVGKAPVSWANGDWKEENEFGPVLTF